MAANSTSGLFQSFNKFVSNKIINWQSSSTEGRFPLEVFYGGLFRNNLEMHLNYIVISPLTYLHLDFTLCSTYATMFILNKLHTINITV